MKPRNVVVTARRGLIRTTRLALKAAGCRGYTTPAPQTPSSRDGQLAVVELARQGLIRIEPCRRNTDFPRPSLTPQVVVRGLSAARLTQACWQASGLVLSPGRARPPIGITPSLALAEILRRVGPAGDQALADETRYFARFDRLQYESRAHLGRDWREVSLAVLAPDNSAALLSFVEAGSYLHKNSNPDDVDAGGLHHLRFRVYLVVRDVTSGERHVLRVPPRFGRYTSATFRRYFPQAGPRGLGQGDARGLIHAATAWTFGLSPDEYDPAIEV